MTIQVSREERAGIILKKFITPGVDDPGFSFVEWLPTGAKECLYLALATCGGDKAERGRRLTAELAARGEKELIEFIDRASANIDLVQLTDPDNWQFLTLEDAYQPLTPFEWVVTKVLGKPSLNIFFGAPKSLKTMLVMDLAISVAAGQSWLSSPGKDNTGFQSVSMPVAWLDFENGPRRIKERLAAFGKARKLAANTTPLHFISMPNPWLDASKTEDVSKLIERIAGLGASLIVIDHFSQILGDVDENTSEVAGVMQNLRWLVETCNAALILIHHQTKNAGRFGISASDSLRGHGSILASCDLACIVKKAITEQETVIVQPVACRGPNLDTFSGKFSYSHKDDGSLELHEARFWGIEVENLDGLVENAILEYLADNPGTNQGELRAVVSEMVEQASDKAIRKNIARLESSKDIVFKIGKQNAKLYSLKGSK